MKSLFTKENRTAVLLSVIASIIFSLFVSPIIEILGNAGNRVIEIIVDYYYVSCANATDTSNSFVKIIAYMVFIWGFTNIVTTFRPYAFPKKNESEPGIPNSAKFISRVILLGTTCFYVWIIMFVYSPTNIKHDFDRRITQITPYVESETIDMLKSNWVSMESKKDYDEIKEEMRFILVSNGLE